MCDVALSTGCARRAVELAVWSTSTARGVQLVDKAGFIAGLNSTQPLAWQAAGSSTPDRASDHSRATRCDISMRRTPHGEMDLLVADNGVGIETVRTGDSNHPPAKPGAFML